MATPLVQISHRTCSRRLKRSRKSLPWKNTYQPRWKLTIFHSEREPANATTSRSVRGSVGKPRSFDCVIHPLLPHNESKGGHARWCGVSINEIRKPQTTEKMCPQNRLLNPQNRRITLENAIITTLNRARWTD